AVQRPRELREPRRRPRTRAQLDRQRAHVLDRLAAGVPLVRRARLPLAPAPEVDEGLRDRSSGGPGDGRPMPVDDPVELRARLRRQFGRAPPDVRFADLPRPDRTAECEYLALDLL